MHSLTLTTKCSIIAIASMNSHVHLRNVSGSTPPAREHSAFCPEYNFMNIRVHSKCSSWPPSGSKSVVTSMLHSVRKTSTRHPKNALKSASSLAKALCFSASRLQICRARHITSSVVGGTVLCLFDPLRVIAMVVCAESGCSRTQQIQKSRCYGHGGVSTKIWSWNVEKTLKNGYALSNNSCFSK